MAETLLCASFTEAEGVDPVGTAGSYHDVIVVDVPLPWPREILDHELLVGVADAVADAASRGRMVRVLGSVPEGNRPALVRHWTRPIDRPVFQFAGKSFAPDDINEGVLAAVAGERRGEPIVYRHLLVCTHGTRDRCCGAFGTRMHAYLAAGTSACVFLRISHTGGHRFAPTAISMPEGRGWGFLDETVADQIAERTGPASTLRRHDRGSLTMPPAAQVIDAALLSQRGWTWLDTPRLGRVVAEDDNATTAEVAWTEPDGTAHTATGVVRLLREIPSVDCGVAIDPNKSFPEWGLDSLTIV